MGNRTIPQIIESVRVLTQANEAGDARVLLAELAGHKNKSLLECVNATHEEIGYLPEPLQTLRAKLFVPVWEALEINYPEYIEEIKKAL